MRCLSPYFPRSPDVPRMDDHRVISGIIAVIRHGLQWRDAPAAYGPPKMLIDHFARWSCLGVFGRVFAALAAKAEPRERLMIDSIRLETQPAADSLPKKDFPRWIGRTKSDLNFKRHAVCDGQGRPLLMLLNEEQASEHRGAILMLPHLPTARTLVSDRGYDHGCFRTALQDRGIIPCIPSMRSMKLPISHNAALHYQRHRIENMFSRI